MTAEYWKKIPEWLDSPAAVFVTGEGLPLFSLGNAMLDKSPYRINEANRGKTNALERAISRGGDPITVTPVESPSAMLDDAADDARANALRALADCLRTESAESYIAVAKALDAMNE